MDGTREYYAWRILSEEKGKLQNNISHMWDLDTQQGSSKGLKKI